MSEALGLPKDQLRRLLGGVAAEAGVGIAGMRERFRDLGGSLEIRSNHKGTTVIATIPRSHGSSIGSGKDGKSKRTTSAA
jgi:hypothetical protein